MPYGISLCFSSIVQKCLTLSFVARIFNYLVSTNCLLTNDTFSNLEKLFKIAYLLCHGQTKTYIDQTKIILHVYCLSSSANEKYQITTGRVWVFFTYRPQAILSLSFSLIYCSMFDWIIIICTFYNLNYT